MTPLLLFTPLRSTVVGLTKFSTFRSCTHRSSILPIFVSSGKLFKKTMSTQKKAVSTDKAPVLRFPISQAIIHNGMVYCSGNVGMDPATNEVIGGTVTERTTRALRNLSAVLEAAGSSAKNVVKVNVYLTTMENFQAMNKGYQEFFEDPQPARTCVAVKELPLGTDVEIECIAHL